MMGPDVLQFGAMGLLALVIVGGGKIAVSVAKTLVDSIDGLREEVADTKRLLALLLAHEFGAERANKILEEAPNERRDKQG
jgi:hypothetical protein